MEIRHIIFFIFVASAVYVYFRGKVRFGVIRSLTDYQVLLAPVNTLLYLFSKVKAGAFIPVSQFPEMQPIQDNWEIIRQEALSLQEGAPLQRLPDITTLALIHSLEPAGSAFTFAGMAKRCPQPRQNAQKRLRCLNQSLRSRLPCSPRCRLEQR